MKETTRYRGVQPSANGANVEIIDGAAHLSATARCDSATISGKFNVPLVEGGQAFRFDYRGSENVSVFFQGQTLSLPPKVVSKPFQHCIPSWMNGTVGAVRFSVKSAFGDGACEDLVPRELVLDNIEIVVDASCDVVSGFTNGGFQANASGWYENRSNPDTEISYLAVEGDKFVSVRGAGCSGSVQQSVFIPSDDSVNAVEYTYRMRDNANTQGDISFSGVHSIAQFFVDEDLEATDIPKTKTTCLPEGVSGHPWFATIRGRKRTGEACSESNDGRSQDRVQVGEIKMINDPNCNL